MSEKAKIVADIMSRDLVTVERNDPLTVAEDLMKRKHVRHVLVLDDYGDLCGVVTKRDLFRGAVLRSLGYGQRAEDMLLSKLLIKEAMSEDPVTVGPDASLTEAARILIDKGVGCLPVTEDGKLVGILTEGDFVRLAAGHSAGASPGSTPD
ncbi:MAG TPA: CBS domain-containing protein [Gammaproteobacteria bacterium]|nr:CBS domain-containing protein [Gammaproteobacteria bacterium]